MLCGEVSGGWKEGDNVKGVAGSNGRQLSSRKAFSPES